MNESSQKKSSRYQLLFNELSQYGKLQYQLLKLELLEKLSKIIALLVIIFMIMMFGFSALVFFALAANDLLSQYLPAPALGMVIIGVLFILVITLVILMKTKLLVNPTIKQLSKILFDDSNIPEHEEL